MGRIRFGEGNIAQSREIGRDDTSRGGGKECNLGQRRVKVEINFLETDRRISDVYISQGTMATVDVESRASAGKTRFSFPALLDRHVRVFDVILRRHRTLNSDINPDFQSTSTHPQKTAFLRAPTKLTRFSVLPVHQTFTFDYFHRTLLRFRNRSHRYRYIFV